jgi:hypothetical protein
LRRTADVEAHAGYARSSRPGKALGENHLTLQGDLATILELIERTEKPGYNPATDITIKAAGEQQLNHIGNSIAKVIYRPDADAERYIAEGAWCSEAAGDLLRSCARRYGANTALVSEDARIT